MSLSIVANRKSYRISVIAGIGLQSIGLPIYNTGQSVVAALTSAPYLD